MFDSSGSGLSAGAKARREEDNGGEEEKGEDEEDDEGDQYDFVRLCLRHD